MLNLNMSKKVRNVLSVSALAVAMVPFAVNAATVNFDNTTFAYTDKDVVADSDYNVASGNSLTITATNENVVVDLNGKTVTLADGNITVAGGKNVTIKNGSVVCSANTSDCIDASTSTGNVTIEGVKVTSKGTGKNAVSGTSKTTIKGGTIEAESTGKTVTGDTKVTSNAVLKSAVDTNVEISGTVTAPISAVANAKEGATIKVEELTPAGDTASYTGDGKITLDLSNVKFTEKDAAGAFVIPSTYTLTYDSSKVNVVYPTSILEKMITSDKLVVKKADTKAFDAATEAWTKLDADKKDEIKKNYESSLVDSIDDIITKGTSKDVRDQAVIDQMTNIINKMIKGETITDADKTLVENEAAKPADKNAENKNQPTNVADVKSEDNVATKNPKTADSILSYVGLAISSLAGLGVAAKKYLFK